MLRAVLFDSTGIEDIVDNDQVCTDDVHTVSTDGMAPGVYVLRLINGSEVKTQRIVVR